MHASRRFLTMIPFACFVLMAGHAAIAQSTDATGTTARQDSSMDALIKDRALKRRIKLWEWTLTQIAKREKATLFVDAPLDRDPPNIAYDRPFGVGTMKALANSTERKWKQLNGIQTFMRPSVRNGQEQLSDALTWLAAMSDEDLGRLIDGKTTIASLDPSAQENMLGLAGGDPDMNFALLGKEDATQVKLTIGPKIRYTDPKTGATKEVVIPYHPPAATGLAHGADAPLKALDSPEKGALIFGAGSILTLANIIKRAEATFHVQYVVDGRVEENRYFVSGSITQKDFEAALDLVTTVPPVHLKKPGRDRNSELALLRARMQAADPGKIDLTHLRDYLQITSSTDMDKLNQQYGSSEQLDVSDFLEQKSMTASAFGQGMPGLSSFLQREGIGPNVMLTLDASIGFDFQALGQHIMSNQTSTVGGVSAPVWGQNESSIGLE